MLYVIVAHGCVSSEIKCFREGDLWYSVESHSIYVGGHNPGKWRLKSEKGQFSRWAALFFHWWQLKQFCHSPGLQQQHRSQKSVCVKWTCVGWNWELCLAAESDLCVLDSFFQFCIISLTVIALLTMRWVWDVLHETSALHGVQHVCNRFVEQEKNIFSVISSELRHTSNDNLCSLFIWDETEVKVWSEWL